MSLSKPVISDEAEPSVAESLHKIWDLLVGDIGTVLVFGPGHVIPEYPAPVYNRTDYIYPGGLTNWYSGSIPLTFTPGTEITKIEVYGDVQVGAGNDVHTDLGSQGHTAAQSYIVSCTISGGETSASNTVSHIVSELNSYKLRISARAATTTTDSKFYRVRVYFNLPTLVYEV